MQSGPDRIGIVSLRAVSAIRVLGPAPSTFARLAFAAGLRILSVNLGGFCPQADDAAVQHGNYNLALCIHQ